MAVALKLPQDVGPYRPNWALQGAFGLRIHRVFAGAARTWPPSISSAVLQARSGSGWALWSLSSGSMGTALSGVLLRSYCKLSHVANSICGTLSRCDPLWRSFFRFRFWRAWLSLTSPCAIAGSGRHLWQRGLRVDFPLVRPAAPALSTLGRASHSSR